MVWYGEDGIIGEYECPATNQYPYQMFKVNKQDFLQVFQGIGIKKMEDNSTSVDLLSFTTKWIRVDQVSLVSLLDCIKPTHQIPVESGSFISFRRTGKQLMI